MYQRRAFLTGLLGVGIATSVRAAPRMHRRPGIAVTIDDFDLADTPLMTGLERDRRIRKVLARHRIKAAGFPAGKFIHGVVSDEVLRSWSSEGHIIGNHSFSHSYYGTDDPDAYMADILKCEALLTGYSGFRKLFRYPYLAEGKTAQARDALRERLHAAGYRNGQVTIDNSDWAIDARL